MFIKVFGYTFDLFNTFGKINIFISSSRFYVSKFILRILELRIVGKHSVVARVAIVTTSQRSLQNSPKWRANPLLIPKAWVFRKN